MGKVNDLTVQLQERGVPEEVYQEASVFEALRVLSDAVLLEKTEGKWLIKEYEDVA